MKSTEIRMMSKRMLDSISFLREAAREWQQPFTGTVTRGVKEDERLSVQYHIFPNMSYTCWTKLEDGSIMVMSANWGSDSVTYIGPDDNETCEYIVDRVRDLCHKK